MQWEKHRYQERNRQGTFQDKNGNYLLLSASDTEGYEGRAVTFMEGEDAYGWIKEKYNVGILRPNPEGEGAYVITASGTAF